MRAFDNGVTADTAALAGQADAATRAVAASASSAARAAATYQTDSACCASPPRPARRDFGFGLPADVALGAPQGQPEAEEYSP